MTRRSRIMKIVLLVFFVILVVMLIANLLAARKIRKELVKLAGAQLSPEAVVHIQTVKANLLTCSVRLSDIQIQVQGKDREHSLNFEIRKIRLRGFHVLSFLRDKTIEVDKLRIHQLTAAIGHQLKIESQKSVNQRGKTKLILLHEVILDESHLQWFSGPRQEAYLHNLSLGIQELRYLPQAAKDSSWSYHDIHLDYDSAGMNTSDGMYRISSGALSFRALDDSLRLQDIQLKPLYDLYAFTEILGYQTDRFDVAVKELEISGIPLSDVLTKGTLHLKKISLGMVQSDIFRNKLLDLPPNHYPPMPQQAIDRLPFRLMIDTLEVEQAHVKYSERVPGSPEAGYVYFDRMHLLVRNLNNAPAYFGAGKAFEVYARGLFNGKGEARAALSFSYPDDSCRFSFSGAMEAVGLDAFNTMLVPNAGMRIDGGKLNHLQFEYTGTCTRSEGKLEMLYQDLDVALLKQKEGQEGKEKKLFSFILNKALRSGNPTSYNAPALEAHTGFDRDMHKGIINFVWKSVLSGIKATVTPGRKNLVEKPK